MQRWLAQRGYSAADAGKGAARVQAALAATLSSEEGRWVLQQRADGDSELALASHDGATVALNVVDRTFIEDGVRWIIDYKSAQLGEASSGLAAAAENYRPQLERYAALFKHEGLPLKLAVFFLSSGKLVLFD